MKLLLLLSVGLFTSLPAFADIAPTPSCRCQVAGTGTSLPVGGAALGGLAVALIAGRRR